VRDVTTSSTTDEAYGAGGNLLWRYTGSSSDPNQRAFVPFEGGILAEYYAGVTIFDHPDEIGSMATSSDYTGNNFNEKLFYPFGELWTGAAIPNLNMHQTFAQLPDYDSETDQYNTANRHYNPTGRWLTPDPGGLKVVKLDDPQTWNMYVYVRNNPTTSTDPTGLACIAGVTVFGSHFGGRCPGDTPPPPPPPPPSPLQTDQDARTTLMAPTRPSSRTETVYQIGGIVNAEAGAMKDSAAENVPLSTARQGIAEVRINGDQLWGDRVGAHARMAPAIYAGPDFQASLDAAANAAWDKLNGASLTGGATNYRMWKSTDEAGPFWNMPVYTTEGPYLSKTPNTVISTYGPLID
jgi:RHS repeat-associated protein